MKQDNKDREPITLMAKVDLAPSARADVWDEIEERIDDYERQSDGAKASKNRTRSGFQMIKTTAAATAMLAIVGGGIGYTMHHHAGSNVPSKNTSVTTAGHEQQGLSPIKEYGLFPVSYTQTQLAEIKNLADSQGLQSPYVPTEMGGPSGYYSLLNASGKAHVMALNFNDMTILNARYFEDLKKWFTATGQKTSFVAQQKVKLANGMNAQWWQVNYSKGAMAQFLALQVGNTWIALEPNPAHPLKSFEEGVANYMTLLAKVSGSHPTDKTQFTNTQLANMSAQQLATYNVQHHQPLPFASGDITRNIPNQPLAVSNPKSSSINPPGAIHGTKLNASNFYVIDRWTCAIPGSPYGISIEVDKKKDGSQYLLGIARGPQISAYSFHKQPYITNFTGSYMVFATPNPAQGNPFYALNLKTGQMIYSQTAYEMSNDYGPMGGASGMILGIPNSYTSLPTTPDLFTSLPFKTKVPSGMTAIRTDTSHAIVLRFESANHRGYFEIVYPKRQITKAEVLNWVKVYSVTSMLPKVTVPMSVHSPFVDTYQAYRGSASTKTFHSVQVGFYNKQYFFVVSSYESDMADMMTAYENDVLSEWVWNHTGKRFDPYLPQSNTNQGP